VERKVLVCSACCLVVVGVDALLGPEGTSVLLVAACWLGCLTSPGVGVVAAGGLVVWLCVECCIVDASILLWSSV
jgi:hypothetical protein